MFQTKVIEKKSKARFYSMTLFFLGNRAYCETKWKNMVQPDRPQMTVLPARGVYKLDN